MAETNEFFKYKALVFDCYGTLIVRALIQRHSTSIRT